MQFKIKDVVLTYTAEEFKAVVREAIKLHLEKKNFIIDPDSNLDIKLINTFGGTYEAVDFTEAHLLIKPMEQ